MENDSIFGNGKCYLLFVKDNGCHFKKVQENWKTSEPHHGGFDKYFVYQQCQEDKKVFCDRLAKPGFEYLENNHSSLEDIEKVVSEAKTQPGAV